MQEKMCIKNGDISPNKISRVKLDVVWFLNLIKPTSKALEKF